MSVVFALFFMFCYQNRRFGNRLLGREVAPPRAKRASEGTVTYNVFYDSTPSSVQYLHRRRKAARHERHKYAKATKGKAHKKKS